MGDKDLLLRDFSTTVSRVVSPINYSPQAVVAVPIPNDVDVYTSDDSFEYLDDRTYDSPCPGRGSGHRPEDCFADSLKGGTLDFL